ncbi:DUF2164 domain-containing protein [Rhodanobacter aciditrophus]|uniref:DUF2164 domain-containing protein n=1 Tax=Rhodanobacter aciditrophus TaxID=1623218 RepID=A0ABW4B1K3_9GAMM
MSDVKLTQEELDRLVVKIKRYFDEELGQDIGAFEAQFLIEFFAREVGPAFYNQGLSDAHSLLNEKVEELSYQIQELEKPIL